MHIELPYKPREFQLESHRLMDSKRFGVIVAHRRFGKSVMVANHLQKAAILAKVPRWRGAFIGPTYKQAKAILWDHLRHYTGRVPLVQYNESELRVDYHNGSRIRLFGADNPDSLRGLYFDWACFDEYDLMQSSVWTEIVRPALVDRGGKATFIGTFKHENGPLGLIADYATANPDEWFLRVFPASQTGVIPEKELAELRATLSTEEYAREFECKRVGSVQGSVFGRWIEEAEEEGRVGEVLPDPRLPVTTAWDLGIGDPCAIWFVQQVGSEVRVIDYHEAKGEGLDYYAQMLREKAAEFGYIYREHLAPFDIGVRELGTGRSRFEVAGQLGLHFRVLPQISQRLRSEEDEQIHAARMLLPRVRFDAKRCMPGLRSLRSWRYVFNEAHQSYSQTPLHDWASHGAKAFCYLALGIREVTRVERPEPNRGWIR